MKASELKEGQDVVFRLFSYALESETYDMATVMGHFPGRVRVGYEEGHTFKTKIVQYKNCVAYCDEGGQIRRFDRIVARVKLLEKEDFKYGR